MASNDVPARCSYLRLFFAFLGVLGILIPFSGCFNVARQAPSQENPPVIHAMLNNILQDWEGQADFATAFQELTGIELIITQPPHQNYTDRAFMQLESNQVPDILELLPEHLPKLINAGLIVPLDGFIKQAEFLGGIKPEFTESLRHPDGKLYAFPARDGGGCVSYIRKDWLDNVGLAVPTDWESLVRVLEAFTYADPNRSGTNDTFGYTDVAAGSQDWYNRLVMGSGRIEIFFDNQRQRWVDGFTMEETRKALVRFKDLFDRGVIDPGITTNTTFSARTKFINGQVGIFTYWANHWARNLQDRAVAADGPEARILAIPPIEGVRYIRRIPPVLVITQASKHPDIVFRNFIDRQYDKGQMQMLFTYGVEGIHWILRDGNPVFLPNPLDPYQANFTKAYVPPGSHINDWDLPMDSDQLISLSLATFRDNPYPDKQKWGGEYFSRYHETIETVLKPEVLTSFLVGERSLEEALAYYSQEAENYYLPAILAELNTIPRQEP